MFFGLPSRNLRLVYHNFKARFHIAGNCLDCYNHDLSNQQWNMLTKGWADWRYSETTNLVMVWFLVTANEVKKYVEHHGDLVWVSNFLSANDDMYYNCLDIYYYLLLEMFHSDYEQFTQFNDVRFRVVSTCIESFEHWMKHPGNLMIRPVQIVEKRWSRRCSSANGAPRFLETPRNST